MNANQISRRGFVGMAGAASLGMMLSGCGTYTSSDSSKSEGSSSEGTASDSFTIIATQPNTLNMIQSASNLDNYCFYLTQEMLFRPYDGVWSPEVVDSFEVSDDSLTYTYHLKETTWSDGTAITAADFAYYLTAQLDPANASANGANFVTLYHFKNADKYYAGECGVEEVGIQATDDTTLVLTLDQVVADFDGTNFTCYPLSASFVAEKGEALGGTADDYMCSGPYVLKEWVYDSQLTYEKNDKYLNADTSFQVKTINWLEKNDENASVTMFEGGQADAILQVNSSSYEQLKDYITKYPGGAIKGVQLNVYGQGDEAKAAVLSNKNFRYALSYAIDRESVAQAASVLYKGANRYLVAPASGKTADTYFADDFPVDDVAAPIAGDTEQAKKYLEAALSELGYASVDELPAMSYLTFDSEAYRNIAELLVDQWKQILGITSITIDLKPVSDAVQSMMTYQYDMYFTALSVTATPAESMGYWITGGAVNDIAASGQNLWSNDEYDQLISQASQETDRASRMALYAEAEKILLQECPLIFIATDEAATALAKGVSGFMENALDNAVELDKLTVTK
jgi:ABC-type oligopeptide transport system substrate-binding subunit